LSKAGVQADVPACGAAGNSASADRRAPGAGSPASAGMCADSENPGAGKVKRYKAVIFDWDGTVMDSTASIVRAIQAACTDLELPVPSVEDASWVIGLSLKEALMRCAPSLKEDQVPRFIDRYRHHFFLHDRQQVLFDGVVPLFEQLKQHDIR